MKVEPFTLEGKYVRLEPLNRNHAEALATASYGADSVLYKWSPVPQGRDEAERYINTALSWRDAGTAVPFATVRRSDNMVIGSSRFFDIVHWAWPAGHPLHGRPTPDICEIGYTWLCPSAIRTPANTEAKLLMLTHAFEVWQLHCVCFHTDVRNERSRAALARIGAQFEGILRSHRMAADFIPRDSARFSIIRSEWPQVKERLDTRLSRSGS
jgi:RimJ/RimL family protein N-acetyltransferase